jgi:tRNA(Arg) A34 adenosine deaminase TadA
MSKTEYPLDKIPHFKDARLASYLSDGKRPGKRLGAVLHKANKKLAFGCNSLTKSHTLQNQSLKPYLHAEISVLLKRRHYEDLDTCSITVYRETSDGRPALARPCLQCQKILRLFGIKKIYFSMSCAPFFSILKL